METKTENTVAVTAMLRQDKQDKYSPVNLMLYRISRSLLKELAADGTFTEKEYGKICTILSRKYGLSSDSIFVEVA